MSVKIETELPTLRDAAEALPTLEMSAAQVLALMGCLKDPTISRGRDKGVAVLHLPVEIRLTDA